MKKIKLAVLFFLSSISVHAQSVSFDYTSNAGWIIEQNLIGTIPIGCAVTPAVINGSVTIGAGRVNFNQVGGAHENRIYTPLGFLFDQQFNMDFDFNITANPSNFGLGAHLATLASQNLNPGWAFPMVTCYGNSLMDAIGVTCSTPLANSPANPRVGIAVYDNGIIVPNPGIIPIAYGINYFARMQIYGNGRGELTLFSNTLRTIRVGSFCFDVPQTIRGLGFLNHGTSAGGGYDRHTSGWVDNAAIYKTGDSCCQINVKGPNVICNPNRTERYSIETTGSSPSVTISPSDVLFTMNTGGQGFTIVDWGTITSAPKEVTITVTSLCGCEEITTTYIVYVYPNLNPIFNISGLGSSGSSLTNFSGVSTEGMTGVIHTWELHTSNVSGTPITLVRGPFTSNGAGSTFAVNSTTPPPALVTGQYYLMTHRMSFANGACAPQDSSRIVYISTKSLIDLGSPVQFSEAEMQEMVKKHESGGFNEKDVLVFPNPTNGSITVETGSEWKTISIVDAGGKVLETISKPAKRQVFNLSAYPSGTYYFKIVSDSGTQLEQFIKQ
ncbi:hypothetical protein D3C87_27740 [compost metagenome]